MFTLKLPQRVKYLRAICYLRGAVKLPAVKVSSKNFDAEVHMMVGKYHLYAAIAALKSFFLHSGLAPQVGLTFHCDATIRPRHERFLKAHFPEANCQKIGERNERLNALLHGRPFCRDFYHNHLFGPKLFQVLAFCRSKRVILLDSDTLFYRRPDAIAEWVATGSDVPMYLDEAAYKVPHQALRLAFEELSRQVGIRCEQLCHFNAGLVLFQPERIDCDLIELFLRYQNQQPNIHTGGWCLEQTAYLINYARWNDATTFDPFDYACGLARGKVFNHFLGSNYYESQTMEWIRMQLHALTASLQNEDCLAE